MIRATADDARESHAETDLWQVASHDFRQPAQTLAFLAAGLNEPASKAERQQQAASIALMAASLEAMVDGLTLVSKYVGGALRADPTTFSLESVLGPLADEAAMIAVRSARRLEVAGLDVRVEADPDIVRRIAHGVLLYVVKHAEGSDITLRVRSRRTHVALEVRYVGPDPAKALSRMAFVELQPTLAAPGVPVIGLGPALGARLATAAGLELEPGLDASTGRILALIMPKGRRKA